MSLNFRSIKNKILHLNTFLINDRIDIFIGSETHLDSTVTENMITIIIIWTQIIEIHTEGVIIGISKQLKPYFIDITTKYFESIPTPLIFKNIKYLICSIYMTLILITKKGCLFLISYQ